MRGAFLVREGAFVQGQIISKDGGHPVLRFQPGVLELPWKIHAASARRRGASEIAKASIGVVVD